MSWYWLDGIIVGIIGLSVITGLFRGFIKELIALCVWVVAIWLAFTYSPTIDPWLSSYIHDKTARAVGSFIAILLATLVMGAIVNALLSFVLHRSGLSGTDRLLGTGFGFIRGVFIVSLLILVVKMTGLPYQQYSKQSHLYAKFDPCVDLLYGYMPDLIKHLKALDKETLKDTIPAT